MKDKILLNVMLPATRRRYEFRVPLDLTVEDAAQLIADIIASREPSRYESTLGVGLMHMEGDGAGIELHPLETLRVISEQGEITDGTRLALI